MTDGELVRLTLSGNAAAGDQLVRRWHARLIGFCHARTGRADAAEELAQETLFRGLRGLATLADPEKLAAWLRGIASRVCVDWIRDKSRTVTLSSIAMSSVSANGDGSNGTGGPRARDGRAHRGHRAVDSRLVSGEVSPARQVERNEEHARLWQAIDRLDEPYREVIMIYYYDGESQTYARVAEMLGVSAATINLRLTRARAMLRADLAAVKSGR